MSGVSARWAAIRLAGLALQLAATGCGMRVSLGDLPIDDEEGQAAFPDGDAEAEDENATGDGDPSGQDGAAFDGSDFDGSDFDGGSFEGGGFDGGFGDASSDGGASDGSAIVDAG